MPGKFPQHLYYCESIDEDIPLPVKYNVILTLKGMEEISAYYKEKYDIEITPFSSTKFKAPQKLYELILKARKKAKEFDAYRCGFIFHDVESGMHGHAMPMIWEKAGTIESLIFLDGGQFLGDTSYCGYQCDFIIDPLFTKDSSLDELPGTSRYAYVQTNHNLFYVDRATKLIKEPLFRRSFFGGTLALDKATLAKIQNYSTELNLPKSTTHSKLCGQLTEATIIKIEEIMTGHFGRNHIGRGALNFRNGLRDFMPNIELYSSVGQRQADFSSCTTDALVMLKDGLRLKLSLAEIAKQKKVPVTESSDTQLFYLPEELLKTAQIGTYPEKSMADLARPMHVHHVKDSNGKKTGDSLLVKLGTFRQKYDVPVTILGEQKKFGSYTLHKGVCFAAIIRQRWENTQRLKLKFSEQDDTLESTMQKALL